MDKQQPAIFTLIACPIIGEFGPDSELVEREPCATCKVPYPEEVSFLDYQFDTWEQAELIKAGRKTYAITRRLYDALQSAGLVGLSTQAMKTSRGPVFASIDPDNKVVLPDFQRLLLVGTADGPSGWWERGKVCPTCNRVIWRNTPRVTDALFAKYGDEPGPPRLVSRATWRGEDAFFLTDPGPPVVTAAFKRIAEQQNVSGLVFAHAEWVE